MARKKRRRSQSNMSSAIVGGILLGIGFLWLGWILFFQRGRPPNVTLPGFASAPTTAPEVQIPQLIAEGIALGHADQSPKLSQQQALFIASQREPDAASRAKVVSARYVLLNYPVASTPTTHLNLTNVPAWMVWYQHIPQAPADPAIDPTPSSHPYHDLYVFLDANTGKELLAVWV